jgi:hypothetical protein
MKDRPQVDDIATLLPVAAAMVAQAPATTLQTDRKRVTQLCMLLAHDRDVRGGVDLRRALRRENVDHYLRHGCRGQVSASLGTYQSHLYRFGRILHPADYPAAPVKVDRTAVRAPYDHREVTALYRMRLGLSDHLSGRLTAVLDLTTGAGARSEEMTTLTGASMHPISTGRGNVVCVDLPSRRTGELRTVPILDDAKAGRLMQRAQHVGPDGWLVTGSRHNAVNSVQQAVRDRGVDITMSAVRLRHAWIVDMAQHGIPTAMLLSIADLGDSHTLYDLSKWMRTYEPAEAAEWLREALS